jgi:hypothetical protein
MNGQRIVAGGLVAGLIVNIGGLVLAALAGASNDGAGSLASFNGAMPLPVAILRGFLLGVFCVLLYASLRPHMKPGPRTAITAGLLAFIFGVLFPPFGTSLTPAESAAALLAATIGQAVVLPLATLAGGWLYRDAPHGAPIAAAVS